MANIIFYELIDPNKKMKGETKDLFWSTDGYSKVELERIYPAHHPIDGTRIPKDLSMIRRWMERECQGEIIIKEYMAGGSLYVFAYFEFEEDAIQCKLTWCT